uniref:RNA-directed DNA polymerase, eukaryota n=1 Tax=Tanacetum cinerariifolium TaxID=118510 RepID=A0A6L2KQZ4_TANCI|nr:RNA-directed DNA polymerase, eukaryota [Tanacetum cinerariifolium]
MGCWGRVGWYCSSKGKCTGEASVGVNKAGIKLSKLDRLLISEEVVEALPDVRVTAIDRMWSDHNPILLHVSKSKFGQATFKFLHSWLLRDSFDEVVKIELPKLEEHNFGRKLLSHKKVTSSKLELSNGILKLKLLIVLCALDCDTLETPVSLEEVKNVVWDCGSFKAPSPDGFSFAFVKKYWDDIKVDILEFVNIFFDTGVHYNIIAKVLANRLAKKLTKLKILMCSLWALMELFFVKDARCIIDSKILSSLAPPTV